MARKERASRLILLLTLDIGNVHLLFLKRIGAYTESFDIDPKIYKSISFNCQVPA
jgi:hypothetical protein